MVAGLAFLSKKNFNPSNLANQKQVWEAQQRKKQEEARIKDRQEQLQREREDEELAHARGEKTRLRFMYQPPPGLETAKDPASANKIDNDQSVAVMPMSESLTTVHPGDDAAAAAFRRMLAASSTGDEQSTDEGVVEKSASKSISTVLQGSNIERVVKKGAAANPNLTALEKEVGRRDGNNGLSLEEQVARFPQLKNAPMAKGMSATDVNVSFKPLGAQLRNVRCLACGIWGHSRGERECKLSGWNPFERRKPAAESAVSQKDEPKSTRREDEDEASTATSVSRGDDSVRERKRRRKSKHRDHRRRKDSRRERRRKRSRSRSPERTRQRRRSRSPSDRRRSRSPSDRRRRRSH